MRNKPEVLAPANSLEVLKTAVEYGADAVYIGGEMYGLRAKAKNFSAEDMKKGIAYAHERGKKVYVTANITAHNRDLEGVRAYFPEYEMHIAPCTNVSISKSSGIFFRISPISSNDNSLAVTTRVAPCSFQKRNVI